jgi:23S rRNA U2552 (ribose-2'-O)-methylase RlmE/FtsJ
MSYLISVTDNRSVKINTSPCLLKYLGDELNKTKSKIDNHINDWDRAKKQIHDYEYVYYSSYRKKNISGFTPVSRSYFKFREIYYEYNIDIDKNSKICNLAEAPGGFIQSIIHLLPKKWVVDIYANSLLSGDKGIPIWNNTIKNYNMNYVYGKQGDGDLCNFLNLISMIHAIGKSSCNLVTGDGGFDYSSDYSKQEFNSLRLIYSEIFMALNIQKKGGTFICKIFDTFLTETIDLLYLLNLSYEKVYLHKPKMSRSSNSEKYIICLNFKGYNKDYVNLLCHSFVSLKLDLIRNSFFYDKIIKYIIEYTLQQIKSINKGIYMIKNKTINNYPNHKQIKLCIEWCKKYYIRINDKCMYLNNSYITQSVYC